MIDYGKNSFSCVNYRRCHSLNKSRKCENYYSDIVSKILSNNKLYYPNDNDNRFFYDDAKYFHKAIQYYGSKPIPDDKMWNCDTRLKDHITDLLALHKDKTPLSDLFPYFQNSDEIIASYICCLIAKYTAIYNCKDPEENEDIEVNLGYACDYLDQLYMEDLFLDTLHTVENYSERK